MHISSLFSLWNVAKEGGNEENLNQTQYRLPKVTFRQKEITAQENLLQIPWDVNELALLLRHKTQLTFFYI